MSLKQRVLAMVLGVMILLALLLGFLWYEHRQSDLQEKIAMRSQTQGVAYNLIVQALHDKTYAFVDKIVHDPKVAELLLRRDREGLYRYVAPIFAQSGVDVAGFVGSDERDFLRLKEPSKYGDRLTDKRPMLANAVRLRTMTSGFDATIYGPHYMVAIPVFNYIGGGEEFLGVFQAGVSVDYLQRRLEELLGSKSAVLFHHKALKLLGLHLSGKEIGDYLLLRDNAPIFSRLPSTLVLDKKVQKIEVDGRLLLLFSEELKGYHGSSIGRIIYYEDITPMKEEFYREILMGLVAAILLIWFIYLVLDLSFSSLLQKLEKNSQFLRTVADSMEEGLAVFNEHWEVTFINRAGLRLIGYEEREVLGRPMLEHLFVPTPEEEMYGISIKNEIKDALRNGERYHERDGEIHRRDGELLSVSYTFSPILDTHGHAGILMLFYDNTSQKEAEEKIKQQAYVDTLTRLKNRNKFFIDLPLTNDPVVFLVNIDSFKEINDFYGETVGDFILV
ncbi:MAG: PAS domain S-box protein, partial [Campylobacterales bacterium]